MTQTKGPDLNKRCSAAALSPAARQVQVAVLTAVAETGQAPARADLERIARRHTADPATVLAELARCDVIVFDTHGEIRAAYPGASCKTSGRASTDRPWTPCSSPRRWLTAERRLVCSPDHLPGGLNRDGAGDDLGVEPVLALNASGRTALRPWPKSRDRHNACRRGRAKRLGGRYGRGR